MVLQFIDKDEFIRILDKPTLTQQDIFKVLLKFWYIYVSKFGGVI